MSMQSLLVELRKISKQLEPEDSYFDRDQLTLGSVVSLPTETLISKALQEYTQYVITTDGDISTITYQVKSKTGAAFGPEVEAKDLAYIPGPVQTIRFGNDLAQSGKNINLIKYHTSRLAPPMVPPSPPGTRSEIVDPHIGLGGAGIRKYELPFDITKFTGVGDVLNLRSLFATTGEHDALRTPDNVQHQVTAGKRLLIFMGEAMAAVAAKGLGLAFADTAVGDSGVAGDAEVILFQPQSWHNVTANQTFELIGVFGEIPSGKFPHALGESTSGSLTSNWLGVEVDN